MSPLTTGVVTEMSFSYSHICREQSRESRTREKAGGLAMVFTSRKEAQRVERFQGIDLTYPLRDRSRKYTD
jgi:hypothetical protein